MLLCVVEGVSSNVIWTKDNITLENAQDNVSLSMTSTGVAQARIGSSLGNISGLYSCQASNTVGFTEHKFLVKHSGKLYS